MGLKTERQDTCEIKIFSTIVVISQVSRSQSPRGLISDIDSE